VVAQFKFQQDDQFARILAKSSLINQQEKRVLELENDREMLREQLVHLQVDLQGQCENETATRLKASTTEGNLRVAAQTAQSRVHYVEGNNAALRQTLHELSELSRALVQDLYSSQLILAEVDLSDEQQDVVQHVSVLKAKIVDDHTVARCRLEFEAGEALLKVERLKKEHQRAQQQLVSTGAHRAMSLLHPQLAVLRASLSDLQAQILKRAQ
jgi:hypothetical protein